MVKQGLLVASVARLFIWVKRKLTVLSFLGGHGLELAMTP